MIGITGASGEVGAKVSQVLSDLNVKHCLLLRDLKKVEPFRNENITARVFDWSLPNSSVLQDLTALFWLLPNEHRHLINAEKEWLDYAKKVGIKHIVKLSSMLAETNDMFFHRESEKLIEESGIPYTHLRANTFMQNFNEHDVNDIKNHVIKYPVGNGKMSFIDTRDIAEIAAKILSNPKEHINKAYTITGSESLDFFEVARLFSAELGVKISYENRSDMQEYPEFYKSVAAGEFSEIDMSAAKILGRQPGTLAKYIHDYRNYFL